MGPVGRPRAIGRAAPDRRPRARDPGVRLPGVLERRRAPVAGRERRDVPGPAHAGRRGEARRVAGQEGLVLSTQADADAHVARLREAAYRVLEVRPKEVKRTPAPAVHHLDAAAGGRAKAGILGPQDHAARPAPVRGRDHPGRGPGGPDHLHANGLGQHGRTGAGGDRAGGKATLRSGVRASPAAPLQEEAARARRRRTRRSGPPAPPVTRTRSGTCWTATRAACTA